MKPLFRKKDIIVNPSLSMGIKEGLEISTFYNKINDVLNAESFLNVVPVDDIDLNIKRANLLSMFKNRVKFLLSNSINLTKASLENLSTIYSEDNSDRYLFIDMGYGNTLVDSIYNDMPYIFDLIFYFNENVSNYSSLMNISLNMTSIIYNELYISCRKIEEREIEQIYNSINKIFMTLFEVFVSDLMTLCQESELYFEAGNYNFNVNTNSFERSILLEQQEFLTDNSVLTHEPKIVLDQEKELYEEFKRFLEANSRNNF